MRLYILPFVAAFMLLCSQCKSPDDRPPKSVEGYAPIYGNTADVNNIFSATTPQPTVSTGKIYTKDNLLYQVETGKGLHIIDITNPTFPTKKGFITVFGIQEMSIQGNLLYANNHNDLVTIDISNLAEVKVINRIQNAFHLHDANKPPTAGWFECADASKGTVIGWQMKTLSYPKCRY